MRRPQAGREARPKIRYFSLSLAMIGPRNGAHGMRTPSFTGPPDSRPDDARPLPRFHGSVTMVFRLVFGQPEGLCDGLRGRWISQKHLF